MTGVEERGREELRLDYSETVAIWRHLVDVRFKLLALVPTLSAIGVGLLGSSEPSYVAVLVAVASILAIAAIAIYDLRNTMFHDTAIHRAKALEVRLGFRRSSRDLPKPTKKGDPLVVAEPRSLAGGYFEDRPRGKLKLFGIVPVWHDLAQWIVYSSSAGAWAAVGIFAFGARHDWPSPWSFGASGGVAVAALFLAGLKQFDRAWNQLIRHGLLPEGGATEPPHEVGR